MADQHDRLLGMAGEHMRTASREPRRDVLKRFAVGKADQMRRGEPGGKQLGIDAP